jgi:hypothetical protein
VARRLVNGSRINPSYALIGPVASKTYRVCRGDKARAAQIRADWIAWRDRYQLDWSRGKAVPPPPHQELFDYARPTR